MDMLDRFLGHDAASTRELLALSRGLSDEELDRPLGVDHGTLRDSLVHVVGVAEQWTDLMLGRAVRWTLLPPGVRSVDELLGRLDVVAADFAALARRAQEEGRLEDTFVYWEEPNPRKRTLGAGIGH